MSESEIKETRAKHKGEPMEPGVYRVVPGEPIYPLDPTEERYFKSSTEWRVDLRHTTNQPIPILAVVKLPWWKRLWRRIRPPRYGDTWCKVLPHEEPKE